MLNLPAHPLPDPCQASDLPPATHPRTGTIRTETRSDFNSVPRALGPDPEGDLILHLLPLLPPPQIPPQNRVSFPVGGGPASLFLTNLLWLPHSLEHMPLTASQASLGVCLHSSSCFETGSHRLAQVSLERVANPPGGKKKPPRCRDHKCEAIHDFHCSSSFFFWVF